MADPYIDPFETQLYGKFAREQMADVCLGKIPSLDKMVHFAIDAQLTADKAMADVIAKAPRAAAAVDPAAVIAEAGDVLVRFGSHVDWVRLLCDGQMPANKSRTQWHLLIDKPSASDELLKALVPKMLALPAGK